jgi:hypothetical protein
MNGKTIIYRLAKDLIVSNDALFGKQGNYYKRPGKSISGLYYLNLLFLRQCTFYISHLSYILIRILILCSRSLKIILHHADSVWQIHFNLITINGS